LVPRCRKAKATKHYRQHMPWLSMWHDAKNEVGMESHTTSLMAKYGITSIPALILLDQHGGLISANAWDKCVADTEGQNFPWRQQSRIPQIGEMGCGLTLHKWPRGQKKETPHQDRRHRLLRRQGGSRLLILTSPHRQGDNQNPHVQGPKHLQEAAQWGCWQDPRQEHMAGRQPQAQWAQPGAGQ
jgi:hypothetical protein